MKTLYILGAGFSKSAGGPLTSDFFKSSKLNSHRKRLNNIYPVLRGLKNTLVSTKAIEDDIEDFMNLVTEAALLGIRINIKGKSYKAKDVYKYLIDYAVNEVTLSISKKLQNLKNRTNLYLPAIYHKFAEKFLRSEESVIVTFNWDPICELLLFTTFGFLDYCLENSIKKDSSIGRINKGIKLLKLHGSLNWLICPNPRCKYHREKRVCIYNVMQAHKVQKVDWCTSCHTFLEKVVVPPVWHKRGYTDLINSLWKIALDEIETSKRIVVIGYSFPKFDISARYLLKFGTTFVNPLVDEILIVNGPNFDLSQIKDIFIVPRVVKRIKNTKMYFEEFVNKNPIK